MKKSNNPLGCFSLSDSVNTQSVFRGLSYGTMGDVCEQAFCILRPHGSDLAYQVSFCNGIAITKKNKTKTF